MLRKITNKSSYTTFYRCPSKSSSLIQLLRYLQQKPEVSQTIEQESQSSDRLQTVKNNNALIKSSEKPFVIRHSIKRNFLITSRNMASSSSNSQPTKFNVSKEELKARLSPIQYQVTQLKATER